MDAPLGTALDGRYTTDREIGAGRIATIYFARDIRHIPSVELKNLTREFGTVLRDV